MNYEAILNRTLAGLKPSGIRRFFDIANELDDVISLSVGEPDFSTPWHIRQKGIETLEKGRTWYSPNAGFMRLREAISGYTERHLGVRYDPKGEVLVTVGGSEAIDLTFRALLEPGDEVLIPEPSFVCYTPLTQMAGGIPVPIVTKAENGFRLTAQELREKITPKTKLLIMPFPNNPTGGVMRREHLEEIAEVLRGTNIMILSDEIYSELTYGGEPHVSIAAIEGMQERTVVVNGFSKSYAMTGWRMGYALAPEPIMKQMVKLHQFAIMSSPTMSQYAAIEALKNGDKDIEMMRNEYDMRRRFLVEGLNRIGMTCFSPEGAFYVFPSIQCTGMTSEEFCTKLLYDKKIAVVPGSAFGESGEGFVRISYSYSRKHLEQALERIEAFVTELKK